MASTPVKDDVLYAKVTLNVYVDDICTKPLPPVPPGFGYRKSFQYPGTKVLGEEIGGFTGRESEVGYEVNFTVKYRNAISLLRPAFDVIEKRVLWVKKGEVTGFWDKGVDAPKIAESVALPAETDNTNTLLAWGLGAALLLKGLPRR